MLTIGLTGGIGSGKSTAARFFAELGIPIIDADQIAHAALAYGTSAYQYVVNHFGDPVLNHHGKLDRKLLRKIVFQNSEARIWLEELLHPLVKHRIGEQIQALDADYCIIAIPLLIESHSLDMVKRILVIDSPLELQIERTRSRDKTSREQVLAIISTQASREQRLKAADDIIHNDSDLEALRAQVIKLHTFYLKLAQAEQI